MHLTGRRPSRPPSCAKPAGLQHEISRLQRVQAGQVDGQVSDASELARGMTK